MADLNEDIISEINGLPDCSEDMKGFLFALMSFEHSNIDKDYVQYKNFIESALNETLLKDA